MCPNNERNGTCQTRPGGKCFSMVNQYLDEETGLVEQERLNGCMSPDDNGGMFQVGVRCERVFIIVNSTRGY